jgi:hypothetical protein
MAIGSGELKIWNALFAYTMDFTRRLSRQAAHVYYQLQKFQDGGWLPTVAISMTPLLWPVLKLKIELSRRNVSTSGRKTELSERLLFSCSKYSYIMN